MWHGETEARHVQEEAVLLPSPLHASLELSDPGILHGAPRGRQSPNIKMNPALPHGTALAIAAK